MRALHASPSCSTIALFARARYEEIAAGLLPLMNQATNPVLLTLIVAFFVVYFADLAGVIGVTAIIAAVIFIAVSFVAGYLLGGAGRCHPQLHRPGMMVMILVVGLVGLVLLMFAGGELGKRTEKPPRSSRG